MEKLEKQNTLKTKLDWAVVIHMYGEVLLEKG